MCMYICTYVCYLMYGHSFDANYGGPAARGTKGIYIYICIYICIYVYIYIYMQVRYLMYGHSFGLWRTSS